MKKHLDPAVMPPGNDSIPCMVIMKQNIGEQGRIARYQGHVFAKDLFLKGRAE